MSSIIDNLHYADKVISELEASLIKKVEGTKNHQEIFDLGMGLQALKDNIRLYTSTSVDNSAKKAIVGVIDTHYDALTMYLESKDDRHNYTFPGNK